MYSRFVLAGPGSQAVRQLAFASNGQRRQGRVVEGKGRQQKMEARIKIRRGEGGLCLELTALKFKTLESLHGTMISQDGA